MGYATTASRVACIDIMIHNFTKDDMYPDGSVKDASNDSAVETRTSGRNDFFLPYNGSPKALGTMRRDSLQSFTAL